MGKVVYLLGAGASYGVRSESGPMIYDAIYPHVNGDVSRVKSKCADIIEGLPIVSELSDRMRYVCTKVLQRRASVGVSSQYYNALDNLYNDLDWAQKESSRHSTIDTFAKKLWLQKEWDDFNRLKRTISAFFLLEQVDNKTDKRYDSFFASILGEHIEDLPENVSVLSWNYDCQFELAYSEFAKEKGIGEIENMLHFNHKSINSVKPYSGFNVLKLNGSAIFFDRDSSTLFDPFGNRNGVELIDFVAFISREAANVKNALSFAWEEMGDLFKNKIRSVLKDATTLVVIGYSFPFFNRRVDRLLFESIPNLEKVYIQDARPDGIEESVNNLLSYGAFDKINKPRLIKIYDTKQFYLPPEL